MFILVDYLQWLFSSLFLNAQYYFESGTAPAPDSLNL
jgi:hypothetical protein